jgi:hypothetical protein
VTVAASYDWRDVLNVIALTGDANHIHIPGSPYEWKHPYVPISETAAKSHGGGKVPKGWKAPSAGGKTAGAKVPSGSGGGLRGLAARHGMRTMAGNGETLILPKGPGIVSPALRVRDGQARTVNGEEVAPHEVEAYLTAYNQHPKALSGGLLDHIRSGGSGEAAGKPPVPPAPVKITQRDLTAIRKQTGLDMGHPDAYQLGAAKPDYAAALSHLAAGRNTEALTAMDSMVAHAKAVKGPEGRHAAAAAVSMRDKVRGALAKPAAKAAAAKAEAAPKAAPAADPEWKRTMDEMAAKEHAAGISNARAMDRNDALHSAQAMHMREATGGITFPHPSDLGGHPGDNGAWKASDHFARGDLPGAAAALDRQAAGETSKARAAKNSKLAAQLRAVTLKPTLPSLAKVQGTQQPDKSFTALDHQGNEYQVRLRPVSLGKSEVTVTRGGRSATAPAGDNPERAARVLAARMAPATDAEIRDAENAVVHGQMLTPRQSEVLRQSNDRLTAQASRQADAARGKAVQAANSPGAAVELSARKEGAVTATAVKPKAGTGKAAAKAPPPAPPRRSKVTPLTPMRTQAAKSMTKLADSMKESHPEMLSHQHVRDAARMLRSGNEEAAQRHLRAAMFSLTPQSLMRNGLHTDEAHTGARDAMHSVHRHLLLVKDISDVAAKNQEALRRDSYGDDATSNPPPPRTDPNAGYGPGALAQKPTARQPPGDQAMNAPGKSDGGGSDPAAADPNGPQKPGSKQFSYGWDDVVRAIDLSARTAMLEATPAPIGKPGGPGLYHVKGLGHAAYFEQVRNGLMKRGIPEGKAHAMTWGILRRWAAGGGKVHPEVRAAAVKALAEEAAKGAAAKASHGHAVTWDDLDAVLEMAAVQSTAGGGPPPAPPTASQSGGGGGSPQARVPAGQAGGGQFGSGSGQATAGKQGTAGKKPAALKPTAHQQHVAHLAHMAQVSTAKAALMATAADDRAKAAGLIQQRNVLAKALASAGGKVSSGQAGSTTAKTAATKTTAPATASTTTSTPAAASTTAAKTPAAATTTAKAAATAAPGTAAAKATAAQLTTQIAALNTQINQLLAAANQAAAQAAAMK